MKTLSSVRSIKWLVPLAILLMAASLQAQTRTSPGRLLGRSVPARIIQSPRVPNRPVIPVQTPAKETSQFMGGGGNMGGLNQGGYGSTGNTTLGMVPRAMPAPMGGGLNSGNMGNMGNTGNLGSVGGTANNGGFRFVTVPTPRITTQIIPRQFFSAGGIRFDTQNQNLTGVQTQIQR